MQISLYLRILLNTYTMIIKSNSRNAYVPSEPRRHELMFWNYTEKLRDLQ